MNARLLDDIHGFWFGDIGDAAVLPEERLRYWMAGGEETDREIRERFGFTIGWRRRRRSEMPQARRSCGS